MLTSNVEVQLPARIPSGFTSAPQITSRTLTYQMLRGIYESTPGLVSDKLKFLLEFVWENLKSGGSKGIILAYDEAQNLSDQAAKEQYPLSILLDVFQSIQKKDIPFILILTGLPTLFPKLVEARTFSERMFHVILVNCDEEFTVQEIVEKAQSVDQKPFSNSHVNQLLSKLQDAGLVYKNRFGEYSFAVPLLGQFIKRQEEESKGLFA